MAKNMRFKSLYKLLDDKFLRVSFNGLINDHPIAYNILKAAYLKYEGYEMLKIMEQERTKIDELFVIFMVKKLFPLIFEIKEDYSETEFALICKTCSIDVKECYEIIDATS